MAQEEEYQIPIFLINGQLDSGKTRFISDTIAMGQFADAKNKLLIVCEEGEEEYSEKLLKDNGVDMVVLEKEELTELNEIVTMYLDYATRQARRHIPMTMEDWAIRIDKFLDSDDRPILIDAGTISAEQAKLHAETEFEKYRIIQDKLFQSDFDHWGTNNLLDFDKKE